MVAHNKKSSFGVHRGNRMGDQKLNEGMQNDMVGNAQLSMDLRSCIHMLTK